MSLLTASCREMKTRRFWPFWFLSARASFFVGSEADAGKRGHGGWVRRKNAVVDYELPLKTRVNPDFGRFLAVFLVVVGACLLFLDISLISYYSHHKSVFSGQKQTQEKRHGGWVWRPVVDCKLPKLVGFGRFFGLSRRVLLSFSGQKQAQEREAGGVSPEEGYRDDCELQIDR